MGSAELKWKLIVLRDKIPDTGKLEEVIKIRKVWGRFEPMMTINQTL